jgi:hypothetical protein
MRARRTSTRWAAPSKCFAAGSTAAWNVYEVRSKRRGALTELVAEFPSSADAARPELLVVPLDVPSPELDVDLDPEDRALVDDAFDNGGFELAPTDAEIDAGRSFALFPPHWAVEPIGAITFDRFAWRGSRSLRFDGTERPASATSPAAELLSIEGAWHARAKVFVDKGATLQLSIAASRVEDPAPRWAELTTSKTIAADRSVGRRGPRGIQRSLGHVHERVGRARLDPYRGSRWQGVDRRCRDGGGGEVAGDRKAPLPQLPFVFRTQPPKTTRPS